MLVPNSHSYPEHPSMRAWNSPKISIAIIALKALANDAFLHMKWVI